MSWRDDLREASFRGVEFFVEGHDLGGGRRAAVYQFPLRDQPATLDLGRKAHRYRIEAYVLGEEYMTARNALLDALDAEGPGELIHPYYGVRTVAVLDWHVRESNRRGGMAVITINCVESWPVELPAESQDTGWAVDQAADTLKTTVTDRFVEVWDVSGPEQVRTSALDKISGELDELSDAVKEATSVVADATPTLTQVIAVKAKVEAMLAYPVTLASQLAGLFDSLFSFDVPNYRLLLSLFTSSSAWATSGTYSSTTPVLSTVGGRIAANATAVTGLLRGALIASAASAAAAQDFATYDDSLVARNAILDALDTEAATADDTVYQALADLRTVVVGDFAARESLPRLVSYTPVATLPALVLAHVIYGDANRADEIVSRNHVRHPGAVPGGTTLQVVTDA